MSLYLSLSLNPQSQSRRLRNCLIFITTAIRFVHDHDARLAALLIRVLVIGMTWLESVFQRFVSISSFFLFPWKKAIVRDAIRQLRQGIVSVSEEYCRRVGSYNELPTSTNNNGNEQPQVLQSSSFSSSSSFSCFSSILARNWCDCRPISMIRMRYHTLCFSRILS